MPHPVFFIAGLLLLVVGASYFADLIKKSRKNKKTDR